MVSASKLCRTMAFDELLHRLKTDKRKEVRHTMTLPVKVAGVDRHKSHWTESTKTVNVSSGGVALLLSKKILIGDVLYLELPLPGRLQKNAHPSEIFKTFAVVRYIEIRKGRQELVRLQFLRNPARIH